MEFTAAKLSALAGSKSAMFVMLVAVLALGIAQGAQARSLLASADADAKVCKDLTTKVQQQVFDALVWPTSASVYLSGRLPAAWDPKVAGELQPSGNYSGNKQVLEFYFGYAGPLSTNTSQNQDLERIVGIETVWMSCNATARLVTAETFMTFKDGYGNPIYVTDVIHVYRFNTARRICGFSLTSKRQEIIIDARPGSTTPALVIPQVCGAIMALCTDANQQYANMTECVMFMSSLTFGTSADLDQNNVLCRRQGLPLVEMDPNSYCKVMGPSGGNRCINHGVSSQYQVKNFIAC